MTIQFSISRNNQFIQASEASGSFAKLSYAQYEKELRYTVSNVVFSVKSFF